MQLPAAASGTGRGDGHNRLKRAGCVRRRGEIHFHSIEVHPIAVNGGKDARRPSRRRSESIQVRGHMPAFQRIDNDLPGGGRICREHFSPIHGAEPAAHIAGRAGRGGKMVGHYVVGVGPDTVVRIIAEIAIGHGKGITSIMSR